MFPNIVHNPDGVPLAGLDPNSTSGTVPDTPRPNTYREHFGKRYIVDPWGYHVHGQDGTTFGGGTILCPGDPTVANPFQGFFGVDRFGVAAMQRFDGGIYADTALQPYDPDWNAYREQLAATLAASTDRWKRGVESDAIDSVETDGSGRIVGVRFRPSVDLSGIGDNPFTVASAGVVPDPERMRVTIFHADGRHSQTYPVTSIDTATVYWTETVGGNSIDLNGNGITDTRGLPENYTLEDISHVLLETSEMRQYSWIMSVRKRGDGNASVDVAVVFNRGVSPENEFAYQATFVPGTNIVGIEYDPSADVLAPGQPAGKPFLKKGGYIFDAVNCRWYRVQNYREKPDFGAWDYGDYEFVAFTEDPIIDAGGEDLVVAAGDFPLNSTLDAGEDRDGDGTLDYGRAVLLPGVIEVYPLGTMQVPEEF